MDNNNCLKSAELPAGQNANITVGVMNDTPLSPPALEGKPLDKVKEPTQKKRNRELER